MLKGKSDFTSRNDFGNFEANIRFLNQTAPISRQTKILEIGSGKGHLLDYFYRQGHDIRGIEINERIVEESKKLYSNLPLTLVSSEILPFDENSFDLVMSFDVFEHIPNTDRHLREVNRVLKEEGFYLLQTPNKWTNIIFETIRWKSFVKWREDHCSLHSYWEIKKRFDENGFEIKFHDIPIINKFFKHKVKTYLGEFGVFLLKIINLDKLPHYIKTNFYIKAKKARVM
jgi:SAM-dependent methyltransferase